MRASPPTSVNGMRPIAEFPDSIRRRISFVVTDVDGTLTEGSRLPAPTYQALARLKQAGVTILPATAAPAGWCDLMSRMWPVDGVIGENGGLFFRHDHAKGETERLFWLGDTERQASMRRLWELGEHIEFLIKSAHVAADQAFRQTTLAMTAPPDVMADIFDEYDSAGAHSTANSLWALAWFGDFDKLAMIRRVMNVRFGLDLDVERERVLYVGDSLNDGPQFGFFPNSVGVANVRRWLDRLPAPPAWVTQGVGGFGFVEVADCLLSGR